MTALDETTYGHLPPHDLEAEACALGAAMLSPNAAATVTEQLAADDFFRPQHKLIFDAVDRLLTRSEIPNVVTVRAELEHGREGNQQLPDGQYLHSLIEQVPIAGSVTAYTKRIRGLRLLRGLAELAPSLTELAFGTPVDDVEHTLDIAHKLFDEATKTATKSSAESVADLITPFLESLEAGEVAGVTTGWLDVDDLLSRLRPGQLIVIGARPSMGKTAAMINVAHHVGVKLGQPVWFGTLEMSKNECMARLVAKDARVDLKKLIEPASLTDQDWEAIQRSTERLLSAGTFFIDDEPKMNIGHIRGALRSLRRSGKPAAVAFVDYLQLMSGGGKRNENRQVEVSEYTRALKLLAKEFEVPIVTGSQLNRGPEHRTDKRPTMADLRESGAIEQDADVVILLHREDAYDPESSRAGEIDFIVDKNRQGPKRTISLVFQGHYSQIADLVRPWSPTEGMS